MSIASGMHEFLAQDRVVWGRPAAEAAAAEADRRGAQRVFIFSIVLSNRLSTLIIDPGPSAKNNPIKK